MTEGSTAAVSVWPHLPGADCSDCTDTDVMEEQRDLLAQWRPQADSRGTTTYISNFLFVCFDDLTAREPVFHLSAFPGHSLAPPLSGVM